MPTKAAAATAPKPPLSASSGTDLTSRMDYAFSLLPDEVELSVFLETDALISERVDMVKRGKGEEDASLLVELVDVLKMNPMLATMAENSLVEKRRVKQLKAAAAPPITTAANAIRAEDLEAILLKEEPMVKRRQSQPTPDTLKNNAVLDEILGGGGGWSDILEKSVEAEEEVAAAARLYQLQDAPVALVALSSGPPMPLPTFTSRSASLTSRSASLTNSFGLSGFGEDVLGGSGFSGDGSRGFAAAVQLPVALGGVPSYSDVLRAAQAPQAPQRRLPRLEDSFDSSDPLMRIRDIGTRGSMGQDDSSPSSSTFRLFGGGGQW
jgi:hypothetical protein